MTSVAFLQQQIDEITLQISQLMSKRAMLFADLTFQQELAVLQQYNLPKPDVQV